MPVTSDVGPLINTYFKMCFSNTCTFLESYNALPKWARPELPTRDCSNDLGCLLQKGQLRRQKMNAGKFKWKRIKNLKYHQRVCRFCMTFQDRLGTRNDPSPHFFLKNYKNETLLLSRMGIYSKHSPPFFALFYMYF